MPVVETATVTIHLLFGALLTGSVMFAAVALVPLAAGGNLREHAVALLVSSLRNLSRLSAILVFLSGGYMISLRGYTGDSLLGSGRGHLVLAMIVLWLVVVALVEAGGSRVGTERGLDSAATRRLFYAAGVASALVLVVAGLLTGG